MIFSSIVSMIKNKVEEKVRGVGAWSGTCTCPDGQTYKVGDKNNRCASLACIGGFSSGCTRNDKSGHGRRVTCAIDYHFLGTDLKRRIYYRKGTGGSWKKISGGLTQVSTSEDGKHFWGIISNKIYYRKGVSGSWKKIKKISGGLKNISVSGDIVWGVNSRDNIYYRKGEKGSWKKVSGGLKQVHAFGNGRFVVGTNKSNNVYLRDGVNGSWQNKKCCLSQVSGAYFSGKVYIVGISPTKGEVYMKKHKERSWKKLSNQITMRHVEITEDGMLWGVSKNKPHNVYSRTISGKWKKMNSVSNFHSISVRKTALKKFRKTALKKLKVIKDILPLIYSKPKWLPYSLNSNCRGHCKESRNCLGSLKCFKRANRERVPGCKIGGGGDRHRINYCYDPSWLNPQKKLTQCQGQCFSHNECEGQLKCFFRNGLGDKRNQVPGCKIGGNGDRRRHNYCYDPRDHPKMIAVTNREKNMKKKEIKLRKKTNKKYDAAKRKAAIKDMKAHEKSLIAAREPGIVVKKFNKTKQCAFPAGYTCIEDGNCQSGWCHLYKCKNKYGYMQPNPGICASNKECADGFFCDGAPVGKCAFKFSSRRLNETCNRGEQCKSHDLATGKGTQCCKKGSNANKRGPLPPFSIGQCTQKKEDWIGAHYCPGEVLFGAGQVPLGEKCNKGLDCANRNIGTGRGTQCCDKKCTQKIINYENTYWCPNDCSGKSSIAGVTPKKSCHLSNGSRKKTVSPKLGNGNMCLEHNHCTSGWCHNYKCRKTYGYLQPKPGACGSNVECNSGLICDPPLVGRCAYGFNSREINETCNRGEQCKDHDLATGEGYQCCTASKGLALPISLSTTIGTCAKKTKDYIGAYYCPGDTAASKKVADDIAEALRLDEIARVAAEAAEVLRLENLKKVAAAAAREAKKVADATAREAKKVAAAAAREAKKLAATASRKAKKVAAAAAREAKKFANTAKNVGNAIGSALKGF